MQTQNVPYRRTKAKMMALILGFAKRDERVKLVTLEGSRANPNAPEDEFQDYDISFLVTDMASFKRDDAWLDAFGPRIIMQKPEAMTMFPPELGNWFTYLMLFEDGNRLDLCLVPLEELDAYLAHDKLVTVLLDKDGLIPNPPVPTDADYHVRRPSIQEFDDCCNEFWWVATYVAKGLCRCELLYAADHLNRIVRPMLLLMLSWKAGLKTDFSVSVGKSHKYLQRYLAPETWKRLCGTYANESYSSLWASLFETLALFRETSLHVARALGYPYPDYDAKVTAYLKRLHEAYRGRC